MSDQWHRAACPECEAVNWVCNGDPNDMTVGDVLGIECYECGEVFPLDEDIPDVDPHWRDSVDVGQRNPS